MRKLINALIRWVREALENPVPERLDDEGYYAMLGTDGYWGA